MGGWGAGARVCICVKSEKCLGRKCGGQYTSTNLEKRTPSIGVKRPSGESSEIDELSLKVSDVDICDGGAEGAGVPEQPMRRFLPHRSLGYRMAICD